MIARSCRVALVIAALVSLPLPSQTRLTGAMDTLGTLSSPGASVYDPARDVVVLVGVLDASTSRTAFAEWNGSRWTRSGLPQGLVTFDSAGTYDVGRRACIYFSYGRTLEWAGASWRNLTPAVSPPALTNAAVAYDAHRDKIVLYGGSLRGAPQRDTWEWDGAAGTWTHIPTNGSPPPLSHHAMTFDAARGTVLLFGGRSSAPDYELQDKTWEYNGSTTTWTQLNPAVAPSPRWRPAMTYDGRRSKAVLYGGSSGENPTADTWEWDSLAATWQQMPAGDAPNARAGATLAFDSRRGRSILYGGRGWWGYAETWSWDGASWTRLADNGTPSHHFERDLVFDTARGTAILTGLETDGETVGTWQWNGETWTRSLTPTGPRQGDTNSTLRTAYDPARQTIVMLASVWGWGEPDRMETWEWDGASWNKVAIQTHPTLRRKHTLGYDPVGRRVVVFGGVGLNDTWEYDAEQRTWRELSTASRPPARYYACLSADTHRERLVLYGGLEHANRGLNDTWEWDGHRWIERTPVDRPPAAPQRCSMTFDAARQRTVLVAADTSQQNWAQWFWEWDGSNWTRRPIGLRRERTHHVLYDPRLRETIVLSSSRFLVQDEETGLYGPVDPASQIAFGTGCRSSSGNVELIAATHDNPWLGDGVALRVTNVPDHAVAALAFGFSDTTWSGIALPLDLALIGGVPGCLVQASWDLVAPVACADWW